MVLVVVSLDPHNIVETDLYLDMEAMGLTARDVYLVHDELTGQTWRWGQHAFVRLTHDDPAHTSHADQVRLSKRCRGAVLPRRVEDAVSGTADPQVADQVTQVHLNARWFAGKGRRVQFRSLTPLPWLTEVSDFLPACCRAGVRFEIAELAYPPEEDPEPLRRLG